MNKIEYPRLGESIHKTVLSNGLTVEVVPRPGFTKKLAYFVTDFGSIHTTFELEGQQYTVPAGVAHFLEHKMFDMPGGRDITAELASLAAAISASVISPRHMAESCSAISALAFSSSAASIPAERVIRPLAL